MCNLIEPFRYNIEPFEEENLNNDVMAAVMEATSNSVKIHIPFGLLWIEGKGRVLFIVDSATFGYSRGTLLRMRVCSM